jgi:hypothetical protein
MAHSVYQVKVMSYQDNFTFAIAKSVRVHYVMTVSGGIIGNVPTPLPVI